MRSLLPLSLIALLTALTACAGDDGGGFFNKPQCSDGEDNDGDGMVDFPDDLGCTSDNDNDESDPPAPQCKDGRDNDGDGKIDYPSDPGCFASHQDSEDDDCPNGPSCPQCSNGIDDDGNGQTDWPNDSGGCSAASDTDEYTQNPVACGSNVMIRKLPFDGRVMGTLDSMQPSSLLSPTCGGAGGEHVYELRVMQPKVVVASTDNSATTANTVLYIRSSDCSNNASEMTCNDDVSTTIKSSTVTQSISLPGTYYLVVDTKDTTAASGGTYNLEVKFLTGEGETCSGADDCGPGLVCRVLAGGAAKVCAKHVCEDGIDDDNDGKIDWPNDPGCSSPTDDDESDTCPGVGPGCPECGDGVDNDGDGKIDFGANGDPTCTSAGDVSEACMSQDGVTAITSAMTMGDTTSALHDTAPSCGSTSSTAPDRVHRLDVPAMDSLSILMAPASGFDTVTYLYNSTCGGTPLACRDPNDMLVNNLAAGTYFLVVDGYYSTSKGTYTINLSGKISNGQSCESVLAQSGAITCNTGYSCQGTMGQRTCQPSQCLDGIDNDGDGKVDYPNDPGCDSPGDNSEGDPAVAPVCSNGADDDSDGMNDWPADFGCRSAAGTSEQFCIGETDPAQSLVTATKTTGTTTMKANDWKPTCGASATATNAAPDAVHPLQLPVPVQTLVLDTIGSGYDTVLTVYDAQCGGVLACDDDGGGSLRSKITMTNVAPGGYAVVVDGYSSANGAYELNIKGTVASGTRCDSPLFSGGANAVLACPANTTCTGTPLRCQ